MQLISTNPSKNYEKIGEVEVSTAEEVRAKVAAGHQAKGMWRDLGVAGRVELLRKVGERLKQNADRITQLEAAEMGMCLKETREDIELGLEYWNYYLDNAEAALRPIVTFENEHEVHEMHRVPRGVTASIVPWNFPLLFFVWSCGQDLVAGNTIVLKFSEETPLCGKLIEELVTAELPPGVFSEVYGDGSVGQLLIEQDVDFICFTGSSATGKLIARTAGERLIPTRLELGGSAPGIVFEDADIPAVVEGIYIPRFVNNGQACDGLKRLIVHRSKYDETVAALSEFIKTKKVGDASNEATDLGPLAAQRQLELLEAQVADAVAKGAQVLLGGKRPDGLQGAYYEPTLLGNITPNMRVWQEEVFGPVLPIVTFETEDEAIKLANDTMYGLGGYIFTGNNERFQRVAMALETCMISQNNLVYIRPENFFGGCKQSGTGREHGSEGFHQVTLSKIIAREK
jgi:acyl-CoA reductase-like NAD-dependent aldehyde dehydrogenase